MEEDDLKIKIQLKLNRGANFLGAFAAILVVLSITPIPFPFIRQLWVREVWGLTGLLDAFLFFLISRNIKRYPLPASFAALGLILNEELLMGHTFWRLLAHGPVTKQPICFMLGSVLVCLLLIILLGDLIEQAWLYKISAHHAYFNLPILVSLIGYVIVLAGLLVTFTHAPIALRYSLLKIASIIGSTVSFLIVGGELQNYLHYRENKNSCFWKIVGHGIGLAVILYVIHAHLPVDSVLQIAS